MPSVIKVRDKAGRSRLLSVNEALAEASRALAAGQHTSALLILEKAVRAAPLNPHARHLLGTSQAGTGNLKEAVYNFNKAVEADPQNAGYRVSLALALLRNNPADAVPHLFAAIDLGSTNSDVFTNLTLILLTQRRDQDVLKVSELGLAACSQHFALLGNRGVALRHLGRYEESLECCRRQLELQAKDARVWSNMGCILTELGRLDEAEEAHAQACRLDPQNASAHFNLAFTLLMNGKFHEGLSEYEWRWNTAGLKSELRNFNQPIWDGSPLAGRKILVHAEQGAGDTIQFTRYLPLVEALGSRITFEVAPSLVRLMTFLPGQHGVIAAGSPPGDFAVHCPLLSLPLKFGTELNSIPPPVPFVIPEEMSEPWARRLSAGKPKVALVWAGSPTQRDDRTRSCPLRCLRPLMSLNSADFFSLQVGERAQDLKIERLSDRVRDLSPFLTDFAETAAALSCVDLVISVDTSVAHLAGALGRPVWLLTSLTPDWRWLRDRSDSPWYPSMRLFRQKTHGDWEAVIDEVLGALRNWLRSVHPTAASQAPNATQARAKLAADFIPCGATVLDLSRGEVALEAFLPYGTKYQSDLPCNTEVSHLVALGVMEYIHDWQAFLKQLCSLQRPIVFSYHPTDFAPTRDQGFVNHLSLADLCAEVYSAGFLVQSSTRFEDQLIMRIQPGQRLARKNLRVLVISNDSLGCQLLHSVLPPTAEVQHARLQTDSLPSADFDLLIVGAGDSLSESLVTDDLLALVRRAPLAVGIFGTEQRQHINQARLSQLLDSMKVWFARSEEDLLLFGKRRANAIHLGDWRIGAFPFTRWTRDETLQAEEELAVRQIQQYRNVISPWIQPFLCALTSAERVAYIEQSTPSGEFRSLLLDIFGRTWPESHLFEFRRECVADYRGKVRRITASMPQLFAELLRKPA